MEIDYKLTGDGRKYGGDGTIHQTGHLDVEVDNSGAIVAVWFRCQALPFRVSYADPARAEQMRAMYRGNVPSLEYVTVHDAG